MHKRSYYSGMDSEKLPAWAAKGHENFQENALIWNSAICWSVESKTIISWRTLQILCWQIRYCWQHAQKMARRKTRTSDRSVQESCWACNRPLPISYSWWGRGRGITRFRRRKWKYNWCWQGINLWWIQKIFIINRRVGVSRYHGYD